MALSDPFKPMARPSPSTISQIPRKTLPKCGWLLPLPEDAERGEKPDKCGDPAPWKIRVKDPVSDVEVDVCNRHKAEHDEKAATLRKGGGPRRKAS